MSNGQQRGSVGKRDVEQSRSKGVALYVQAPHPTMQTARQTNYQWLNSSPDIASNFLRMASMGNSGNQGKRNTNNALNKNSIRRIGFPDQTTRLGSYVEEPPPSYEGFMRTKNGLAPDGIVTSKRERQHLDEYRATPSILEGGDSTDEVEPLMGKLAARGMPTGLDSTSVQLRQYQLWDNVRWTRYANQFARPTNQPSDTTTTPSALLTWANANFDYREHIDNRPAPFEIRPSRVDGSDAASPARKQPLGNVKVVTSNDSL